MLSLAANRKNPFIIKYMLIKQIYDFTETNQHFIPIECTLHRLPSENVSPKSNEAVSRNWQKRGILGCFL